EFRAVTRFSLTKDRPATVIVIETRPCLPRDAAIVTSRRPRPPVQLAVIAVPVRRGRIVAEERDIDVAPPAVEPQPAAKTGPRIVIEHIPTAPANQCVAERCITREAVVGLRQ